MPLDCRPVALSRSILDFYDIRLLVLVLEGIEGEARVKCR